jgi:predicted dehydrogenase
MTSRRLSRRQFIQQSTAAAALAATAGPAFGLMRPISANERIHLGFIGVGGMGRSHFDRLVNHPEVRIIAVADPDQRRQQAAQDHATQNGTTDVAAYTRYHEMLEAYPDLDAVFVATPDHWHALATADCIRAGKDVYCEKPLTLTIQEGQELVRLARAYGRIVQMGTMQRSDMPQFRTACELVRNGRIGELERVVCFFGVNPHAEYIPDEAPPAYLDWDFYLGPAPAREFNPQIHPYNFRYFRDYSGGMLTDWGVHLFDIAQWGMDKDETGPARIEADVQHYRDNLYEFPRVQHIVYTYGDGQRLEWHQGTPEQAAGFEPDQGYGTKFYGSEGEVFVNRATYTARDKKGNPLDETLGPDAERLYAATSHHQDFFDAMRSRDLPICDVAIGHRATSISHLGNIAVRLGRPVQFDPLAQAFPGDPAANALLSKTYRAPWRL